ncbi:MAG: nucleoside deaminase [Bacteroidales bacterium]|jgi:tRNA(adenine34) deaminase|nr:nucleoside deaminase [Bacteroidales bacterium]MBR4638060.1 nucleoside deaminase [Bacteroidales bacterium]
MSLFDNEDEFYMQQALREARAARDEGEIPIGAVIVCDGQIVARAHNNTERLHDVTAHAEMIAFTSAANTLGSKYLPDCTLYVTVEPCPMCAGAAGWVQIGRIVYGASDAKKGFEKLGRGMLHPKTEVTGGVMEEECAMLMKEFFKGKR